MVRRVSCALVLVLFLGGCLTDPTAKRLLDSVQRLSDTLATELENIRRELGATPVEPALVLDEVSWDNYLPCPPYAECLPTEPIILRFGTELTADGRLIPWAALAPPTLPHSWTLEFSSSPLSFASTPFGEHGCDYDYCAYGFWGLHYLHQSEALLAHALDERAEDEEAIREFEIQQSELQVRIATLEIEILALSIELTGLDPGNHERQAILETQIEAKQHELEELSLLNPAPPVHRWSLEDIDDLRAVIASHHVAAENRRQQYVIRPIWTGTLAGLTPAGETVLGSVRLQVDLDTLAGDLRFDQLTLDDGAAWNDGDLDYGVRMIENRFVRTSGDAGTIDGRFYGSQHQVMGGTLERQDLTAAFGGKRPGSGQSPGDPAAQPATP